VTSDVIAYPEVPRDRAPSLAEANEWCRRVARAHYENFSVVSRFFPRKKRQDMFNVYAFCRYSDDLGDEDIGQGDRLAALARWDEEIDAMVAGEPRHPILVALRATVERYGIPAGLLHDLVEAFRMDQTHKRWETFEDLRRYCRHSANPVGRIVLHVFEEAREETFRLSDETCTGLQLANFWQDVRRDFEIGRVYIPQEDLRRFGYEEAALARGVVDGRWRALMAFEVDRARGFFERGLGLLPLVRRELRVDLELFSRGGLAILAAIERRGYDVFAARPTISKGKKAWLVLRALIKLKLRLGRP
jgi:squalene synthase HpnC